MVKWRSVFGSIVTGNAGSAERENGLFCSPTPMLDIVAGSVPVLLTTKSKSEVLVIMTGLKTTAPFVGTLTVVPASTYEYARLEPKPNALTVNVSEPIMRRALEFPGFAGTNVTVRAMLAL